MPIPTEQIGSIPRPRELPGGIAAFAAGAINQEALDALTTQAVRDSIELLEATGSPVITDGEQSKPSFATYPVHGLLYFPKHRLQPGIDFLIMNRNFEQGIDQKAAFAMLIGNRVANQPVKKRFRYGLWRPGRYAAY